MYSYYKININCSAEFSYDFPVHLEYSHDGGYTWSLVKRACYSAVQSDVHECSGISRELKEASLYHKGDFEKFTPVVIPITETIAAE